MATDHDMYGGARLGAVWLLVSLMWACSSQPGGKPVVNLYHAPEEYLQRVVDRCNEQADGRYRIVYHKLPRGADGQREQLVRRLAAGDTEMDVLGIDVTWVAELAEAGWIREWTGDRREVAERGVLSKPLESALWRGKLYAATKNTNVQLLWYRDDLVGAPPATWAEMIETAKRLQAEQKPGRILFTAAQYEGLVVIYNDLVASANGHILSDDGMQATVDAGAVRALALLHQLATSGVTSPSLSNQKEDDIRLSFQAGEAAFQINWPYVYPATEQGNPQVFQHMHWARIPRVDPELPSRATIGGDDLAISRFSLHPDLAFDAALCLRSAQSQKLLAIHAGMPPTIASVYDDAEVADAYPMKDTILAELTDAALRPATPAYQNASTVLSTVLSPPRDIVADKTAAQIREELQAAIESRGVLP